jgi:hypothetical protein
MNDKTEIAPSHDIASFIHVVRGQRMILDEDLAKIYGVETRAFNQATKRNKDRFPSNFVFELSRKDILGISKL